MKTSNLLYSNTPAVIVTTLGLAIVLLWFGIFKFTVTEARNIEGLVSNSPLMNWMYKLFSLNAVSGIIGVLEILSAVGLTIGLFYPRAGLYGSALAVIIFVVTCTFLLSTPGMLAKVDGMWVPSDTGSFLIKDITLLGGSLFLLSYYANKL